jgi:hypothetical protein
VQSLGASSKYPISEDINYTTKDFTTFKVSLLTPIWQQRFNALCAMVHIGCSDVINFSNYNQGNDLHLLNNCEFVLIACNCTPKTILVHNRHVVIAISVTIHCCTSTIKQQAVYSQHHPTCRYKG